MMFDQIGIHGWEDIETVILAAIVSNYAILFIGDIGSNKTEGAKIIARAILKQDIEFRNYEVPTLNFDDLIGFVNPKNLAQGTLQFVPTPLSIWNADAVLFDEINRANPFIQSKLHELIRTRTLMGLPTSLKLVFSAVNPPERYQSGYMDMALASRFVCVQVPSITTMKDKHIDLILSNNGHKPDKLNLRSIINKAKKHRVTDKEQTRINQMCKRIIRELSDKGVIANGRQLKMMTSLVRSGMALHYASGISAFTEPDAITSYVSSVIPEIQGIVRSNINKGMIHGTIRSIVSGFTLGDPITTAKSLNELCDINITDSLAWVTAMKQMAEQEEDTDALKQAVIKIKELSGKEVIEKELAQKLADHLAEKITIGTLINEDVPIMGIEHRALQITASI